MLLILHFHGTFILLEFCHYMGLFIGPLVMLVEYFGCMKIYNYTEIKLLNYLFFYSIVFSAQYFSPFQFCLFLSIVDRIQ